MSPAADVLPEALHSVDGKQFFEFARKSHEGTMQRSSPETSMALRRNLESVIVSAKGAASIRARGNAPGARSSIKPSAESAFQTGGWFSIPNVARNTHGLLYNQNVH